MTREELVKHAKLFQQEEITGYNVYKNLAKLTKDKNNKGVLAKIAGEELKHYNIFKQITGVDIKPKHLLVWFYTMCGRFLGLTFALRLMERAEAKIQKVYERVIPHMPEVKAVKESEEEHEDKLIELIQEERLDYAGSMVLGLNDALVELTGALAGFSLAMQNTRLVAVAGLITGIAASLSMAASQYLSVKTENDKRHAGKSAVYTGLAYIITVAVLILPFIFSESYMLALSLTLIFAILIIASFNFYIAVAKNLNFKHRFFEMVVISIGVSALTFGIGLLVRNYLGISID
ncbi:MAG: vacuolar iron transporter family protein [Tenuifilum sp.]|jgi:VIT1/CCC1 family predicted Fe2+/Mn2+ transporter|uniref:VIT1/CCC1 transporter family protein n=1 Tax=Tenuifilum sp. TaxID=2760880 RepID=UPI0024AC2C5F|nr:VIT1/CCC1 transporter family protein [Tenuifilum sp.]MDI3527613.1 vacuolar iron transporter family protein [Tenuifilum sp.]